MVFGSPKTTPLAEFTFWPGRSWKTRRSVLNQLIGPSTMYGPDDTFAANSNYSSNPAIVKMIAPGVNIYSTWIGGGYTTMTSRFCAPAHVAGAAALYLSTHPGATPAAVLTGLTTSPGVQQIAGIHGETRTYPLVNVSSF